MQGINVARGVRLGGDDRGDQPCIAATLADANCFPRLQVTVHQET